MLHPDWLLESNISIRQVQAQIAKEMISPSSSANSVLQLNMGEGKSSIIVPIVAAVVADGTKLGRVVVLKTLSAQTFCMLLSKLGDMLGRCIFRTPFSKRETSVDAIRAKCQDFEVLSVDDATFREEQERELSPEIDKLRGCQSFGLASTRFIAM